MRLPRSYSLPPGSLFHSMWRCIDGEMFLKNRVVKIMLLNSLFGFLKRALGKVQIYGYCIMDNHLHNAGKLLDSCRYYSAWIRSALSSFAQKLNRNFEKVCPGLRKMGTESPFQKPRRRRGPIGMDRPKTVLLEDEESMMRVMFYIDFNPVRAGLVRDPAYWPFSSYRFYALGEENEWSKHLTIPEWYTRLGDTPEERQKRYKQLAWHYYLEGELPNDNEMEETKAVGSPEFCKRTALMHRQVSRAMARPNRVHPRVLGYLCARFPRLGPDPSVSLSAIGSAPANACRMPSQRRALRSAQFL